MRRALAIAALGTALLPAVSATAGAATPVRTPSVCRPASSTTLLLSREARVYRRGSRVYGCLFAAGRSFRLDRSDFGQRVRRLEISNSRVAGRYAAYTLVVDSPAGVEQSYVYVRNLKNGIRKHHRRAVELASGFGLDEEPAFVDSIVLRPTGSVAWISSAAAGGEVHRIDARRHRLLDTWEEHDIAPRSLRLSRATIRWTSDGVLRLASLV
jgi:hypothetical protein